MGPVLFLFRPRADEEPQQIAEEFAIDALYQPFLYPGQMGKKQMNPEAAQEHQRNRHRCGENWMNDRGGKAEMPENYIEKIVGKIDAEGGAR